MDSTHNVKEYFTTYISSDVQEKLDLSLEETGDLVLREIYCPYCHYLIERVFSDATGHKMVYCQKCKREYPVNLGYFRRMKRRYPQFPPPLLKTERQHR